MYICASLYHRVIKEACEAVNFEHKLTAPVEALGGTEPSHEYHWVSL